jgi:hypothetical protein
MSVSPARHLWLFGQGELCQSDLGRVRIDRACAAFGFLASRLSFFAFLDHEPLLSRVKQERYFKVKSPATLLGAGLRLTPERLAGQIASTSVADLKALMKQDLFQVSRKHENSPGFGFFA